MRRDLQTILRDAIAAGEDIIVMMEWVTEAEFVADRKSQQAIKRCFEILGESLAHCARDFPELAERIPEHRRVVDYRNVLAHGYDAIDPRLVYDLARTRLPGLLESVRAVR